MKTVAPRRGYALVTSLAFVVLFLTLYSLAFRQTAPALRIAQADALRKVRDDGSMRAMARALLLLETGLPPTTPYVCGVVIDTPQGPRSFTTTFTLKGVDEWSVRVVPTPPGSNPVPMPRLFAG